MSNWKQFLQSRLKENISLIGPSATYASLATVTKDNKPSVRTVVIRGFAGEHHQDPTGWESNLLVIHTDRHSRKIEELRHNHHMELNWYMNGTMEQFRIGGTVAIIGGGGDNDDDVDDDVVTLQDDIRHVGPVPTTTTTTPSSLALQAFLKQQGDECDTFRWQAERLRQFVQLNPSMRAQLVHSQVIKTLEITTLDDTTGFWFSEEETKGLLEEAFANFTLLVVKVTSIHYWSPSTGSKSML